MSCNTCRLYSQTNILERKIMDNERVREKAMMKFCNEQ